ncbi:MGMT family protein [Metabacillus malikii]|nr:MGMT family protein [Metabacillus malikii]
MLPFTERVVSLIKSIPHGKVMTYGQIAKLAGSPRGARQVVRILHAMSRKHQLPWHRVVNAKGEIAIKDTEGSDSQYHFLCAEGVQFKREYVVDLNAHQYYPDPQFEH